MTSVHAVVVFVVGVVVMTLSISGLYVLSSLWRFWQINDPIISLILSIGSFSIVSVRIAWPLFGYWADLILTAYGSGDDE